MMPKQLCISADSHVVEAPEVFDGLVERFSEDEAVFPILRTTSASPYHYIRNLLPASRFVKSSLRSL
jgi:hypothetical protein